MARNHRSQLHGPQAKVKHRGVPLGRPPMRGARFGKRTRGIERSAKMPFVPPEEWFEPTETNGTDYRIRVDSAGPGFRHVLSPDEIRDRLADLPDSFLEPLDLVQQSRMTRKKLSFPCYGMQWGSTIYLYPIEDDRVEHFDRPPRPEVMQECTMFGGRWQQEGDSAWRLVWTEQAIKDFYLNNILIHELGHMLDDRNSGYTDRERYAEWFAIEYGYKRSRRLDSPQRPTVRRHHAK
jgi:hypothetical protein